MHSNLSDEINQNIAKSELDGGIWVKDLKKGDQVLIQTKNTLYRLTKLGEDDLTIEGHYRFCPRPVPTRIAGSTWGGSMLKMGWIGLGMHLEFTAPNFGVITTSQIKSLEILCNGSSNQG